jgi:hypothetical protein
MLIKSEVSSTVRIIMCEKKRSRIFRVFWIMSIPFRFCVVGLAGLVFLWNCFLEDVQTLGIRSVGAVQRLRRSSRRDRED